MSPGQKESTKILLLLPFLPIMCSNRLHSFHNMQLRLNVFICFIWCALSRFASIHFALELSLFLASKLLVSNGFVFAIVSIRQFGDCRGMGVHQTVCYFFRLTFFATFLRQHM